MRAKQELRPIVNDAPSTGARTRDATFQYNYADGFIGNWFMGVFIDDTRMLILGAEYRTVRCVCGYFHFHTHTHTENRHGPWVYGLWLWNDLFFWDRRLCGSIGHSAFGSTSYLISFKFPFASNIRWVAPCTAGRVFQSGFFFFVYDSLQSTRECIYVQPVFANRHSNQAFTSIYRLPSAFPHSVGTVCIPNPSLSISMHALHTDAHIHTHHKSHTIYIRCAHTQICEFFEFCRVREYKQQQKREKKKREKRDRSAQTNNNHNELNKKRKKLTRQDCWTDDAVCVCWCV